MERTRDSVLREAVLERLLNNEVTASSSIEVISLAEQITLRGVVSSPEVKQVAEQEAKTVPGVHQVINELVIESGEEQGGLKPPPILPHRAQ